MTNSKAGAVHAIASLSALDGPGLRYTVFLQGCPLRCQMCHNPDTWAVHGGRRVDAEALAAQAARYKPYFGTQGGVTLTGGEPLMQVGFCLAMAGACRSRGISLCIETSGYHLDGPVKRLLSQVDLVILDIKHTDPDAFRAFTGRGMEKVVDFVSYMRETKQPVWLRQVVIPGINDSPQQIRALAQLVKGVNVSRVQLMPYHNMGKQKWEKMGIFYPLEGVSPPTRAQMARLQGLLETLLSGNGQPS